MTILLGYGSHGKDIHAIWKRDPNHKGDELGLYDDHNYYLELINRIGMAPTDNFFVGINNPRQRYILAHEYYRWHDCEKDPGIAVTVDPSAIIDGWDRKWGCPTGVVIGPNVLMLHDVHICDHTHINYGVQMTRCQIGSYVTIAPGVTICGDVKIGSQTFIGAGAVISNLVTIGDGCIVGAGAVVVNDVPDGQTVVGVPAKCLLKSTV